jgi:hypothetical protein
MAIHTSVPPTTATDLPLSFCTDAVSRKES